MEMKINKKALFVSILFFLYGISPWFFLYKDIFIGEPYYFLFIPIQILIFPVSVVINSKFFCPLGPNGFFDQMCFGFINPDNLIFWGEILTTLILSIIIYFVIVKIGNKRNKKPRK